FVRMARRILRIPLDPLIPPRLGWCAALARASQPIPAVGDLCAPEQAVLYAKYAKIWRSPVQFRVRRSAFGVKINPLRTPNAEHRTPDEYPCTRPGLLARTWTLILCNPCPPSRPHERISCLWVPAATLLSPLTTKGKMFGLDEPWPLCQAQA